MALNRYCLIHMVFITINCAVNIKCKANSDGNGSQKRKMSFQPSKDCEYTPSAKKIMIDSEQKSLSEQGAFDIDESICDAGRTDTNRTPLPSFNQAFGACSMGKHFCQFKSYDESNNGEPDVIVAYFAGQALNNYEDFFPGHDAETHTSLETQCSDHAHGFCITTFCDISTPRNSDQKPNDQTALEGVTKPKSQCLNDNKDKKSHQSNQKELQADSRLTVHLEPGVKNELSDAAKEGFDRLLKEYTAKVQHNKYKYASSRMYNSEIIENDLETFQAIQQIGPVEFTDVENGQKDSSTQITLPDFEKYYERCGSNLSCETDKFTLFSQKWSSLKDTEGHILLYADIFEEMKEILYNAPENEIYEKIGNLCAKHYIKPDMVTKENWKYDRIYLIQDYINCFVRMQKVNDSDVPINIANYPLTNAKNYSAKFEIFKQFIFDTFFSKGSSVCFHTIKRTLWRLQIFMPEIFFYLSWRLRTTNDISARKGCKKYGLKEEIEILASLVNTYYKVNQTRFYTELDITTITSVVGKLRLQILTMLEKHYETSAMYQFYKIAHRSSLTGQRKFDCLRSRDIIYIIAFAVQTPAYNIVSQKIQNFVKKNNGNEIIKLSHLIQKRIDPIIELKRETIKILQTLVKFIRKIKPYSNASEVEEINLYILFKYRTLLITPGANLQSVSIYSQRFGELLIYFHKIIFDSFAY